MSNNTGGPAFPPFHDPNTHTYGMDLRDYFAAKAMVGLMSMERSGEYVDEEGNPNDDETGILFAHTHFLAEEAYMIADMMLKARIS